ncbi:MAG: endonuclease/exonuclease/phosphatase family protein [Bacteroidota bacterium]
MKTSLLCLAAFFVVATALPLIREPYWWIRMFDFPRAQLAVLGVVTLGLMLAFYERGSWPDYAVLGLVGLCLVFQLWRIWPYTGLHPVQSAPAAMTSSDRTFRLVVSNVLMDNRDSETWLRVIRDADPDMVVAVETDAWWAEQARALEAEWPHTVLEPLENTYGMLVYSRWPLSETETRYLVQDDVPSMWGRVELPSGDRVRFAFIHPRPPRPDIQQDSEARDAELVLVARELEGENGPVVVAGDLNDVAWSYTTRLFQRISGLLDPRIGRGLYATFHADYPVMRWPLDHVFHSEDLQVIRIERLAHVGSDHFPIMIDLAYEPERSDEQAAPEADAEDQDAAEEILDKARE